MSEKRYNGWRLVDRAARNQAVDLESRICLLMIEDVEGQVVEVKRNEQVSL